MPTEERVPLTLASREEDGALPAVMEPTASLLLARVPPFARTHAGKLTLLACACAMEATCYTLCVPFMTTHLNTTYAISISDAGFVFVAYTIGSVCSTPLVEVITERTGCSGAICAGVLVLGLSQLAFLVARGLPALFAARFVGGMAAGLIWSAVLTSCHLMSLREGNMGTLFGTVLSAVSIGTMLGPALGGTMYRFGGWSLPLALIAAACLLFAVAVALLLPEEGRVAAGQHGGGHGGRASGSQGAADKPRNGGKGAGCCAIASWRLLSVLFIVMSGAMAFSSIDSVLPIHLQRAYGYTSLQTALVFLVISVRAATRARPAFGLRTAHEAQQQCLFPSLRARACPRPHAPHPAVLATRRRASLRAQIFYGLAAPTFGSLADRTGKALEVSMGGTVGLALLLPVFAMPLPHWAVYGVAVLFGTCATAQLTPASTLLEQVAAEVVGDHPTLTYAVFNCAYVSGMAVGPGVLAFLTDRLTFQAATLCVSAGALAISTLAACHVRAMQGDDAAEQ